MNLIGYSSDSLETNKKYRAKNQTIQSTSQDIEMVEAHYFHNYLFPNNEKRCYRNKLTLGIDNVVYLGVTLKDKTNWHWKVEPIEVDVKRVLRLGKMFYQYEWNGVVEYAANILNVRNAVGRATINIIDEPKLKPIPKPKRELSSIERSESTKQKLSKFEILRRQFDALPDNDKYCCYCETPLDRLSVTRDHLVPKSKGGVGVDYGHENIRPCCTACNSEKGNLLLRQYIGKLNMKFCQSVGSEKDKLQIKIINANKIAIELAARSAAV